jgi:nucleoside-diphosphate-sugar epimerase
MVVAAITGITGLAGGQVSRALIAAGYDVVGISRRRASEASLPMLHTVPDLTDVAGLTVALEKCDIVFHFADRADRKTYGEQHVNTAAAVMTALRTACANNGVHRIVAASSVYAERDEHVDDLYGRSKRAMEAVALAPSPATPAVILRLPPLHGPGAQGAVRHVMRAIAKGWPLPLALATAPRRFLSLSALADLCVHLTQLDTAAFARAAGRIWVPVNESQGSLAALARSLGGDRTKLFPMPGIDRLLSGQITAERLEQDRQALLAATGWQAKD